MVENTWEILEYRENHIVFKEKVEGRYVIESVSKSLLKYILDLQVLNKIV